MMNIHQRHKQLLADYKALTAIASVHDETGAFLPDENLVRLFETPAKKEVCAIMMEYIEHWFSYGVDSEGTGFIGNTVGRAKVSSFIDDYPHLYEIADRYGIEIKA